MGKINSWILSLFGGLLLFLAWPPLPFTGLLLVSLVPFFLLEEKAFRYGTPHFRFSLQVYAGHLLWNILCTYWVWHASPPGAIFAILANSLIQTIPWWAYHKTRIVAGNRIANFSIFFYILALEYLHLNWEIAWPWLVLGNGLASAPELAQWYEYTGALGGSVWVIGISLWVASIIIKKRLVSLWKPALGIAIPIGTSLILLMGAVTLNKGRSANVMVVQPNIDPYNDKFSGMSAEQQLDRLLHLTDSAMTESITLILWPETSLIDDYVEENIEFHSGYKRIMRWMIKHPDVTLIAGANTYHFFQPGEELSNTARKSGDIYYDVYNTAIRMRDGDKPQFYHKSKLVPGVERMPYPGLFGFLEKLAINLEGTSGSLGMSDTAKVFNAGGFKVAPVICYESVFGGYVSRYADNGANLLGIITNDGWWKNTSGYKQHFDYARLRAIEQRMYVARSANTGISGFIDPHGHAYDQSEWWVQDVKTAYLAPRSERTYYSRHGDYLGTLAAFLAVITFLSTLVRKKTKRGY